MSNTQEAITRLATQLQMVYRDFEEANQSRYRMKSQIILTNLQPDTPVSSLRIKPLIQFHRLNEPSQVLAPVFMHIIKTQWPMLMLNRGLTASFTTDTQFAEFIERHSGSIWQFTVGRHPELPNNPTQWWKLEHFPGPELLPDDVYEDAISEGIIEFVNLRLDEDDDDDDDVPPHGLYLRGKSTRPRARRRRHLLHLHLRRQHHPHDRLRAQLPPGVHPAVAADRAERLPNVPQEPLRLSIDDAPRENGEERNRRQCALPGV